MSVRFALAKLTASVATAGLKHVFHRPAANFPGKFGLYVDPNLIGHLSDKLKAGSIVVVGTNGKTTTTNLVADAIEQSSRTAVCNRTGANLDSGVATALLHADRSDWGVFESDELWLSKILPQLQADYVVLLNLFRDQLDRCGEIDVIQASIVGALQSSPTTTLVFNADDPLCAAIAERAGNPAIAFGIDEDLGLAQNTVADSHMCQRCSAMMEYAYRQYGQLGDYRCPECGFARPTLDYAVRDVRLGVDGIELAVHTPAGERIALSGPASGAYMAYNLAAVAVAAHLTGCSADDTQRAISVFDPRNGRLEHLTIDGRDVLLNLAKNPTGFNQNLKIVTQTDGPCAVGFFINDKEADGRDVSWLWDIDFEELAAHPGITVFAGGIRGRDMLVRLKYADIEATLVESAADMMARVAAQPTCVPAFLIANYTALPGAKADLERLAAAESPSDGTARAHATQEAGETAPHATARKDGTAPATAEPALVIAHLYPDLLNLYGDGGNVRVLAQRCAWRGIPCDVRSVNYGDDIDFSQVDLVFLGGGPDREQRLAATCIAQMRDRLSAFVEDDGVLLAICGGYQILGSTWLSDDEIVEGLSILDIETHRPGTSTDRIIGDIVLDSPLADLPVVGYENHAGRTFLGRGARPFGRVRSSCGKGNNDADGADGALYRNVVGTYVHGPLLAKNPGVADWLIARALERREARTGAPAPALAPLDDSAEIAANDALRKRFGAQ